MDVEEGVCDADPDILVYSLRMEWLGLDGKTYINSSVRVEWSETDSRAVCEIPKKLSDSRPVPESMYVFAPQDSDILGHCSRCFVQLFAFAALALLLLRGLGVHSVRSVPLSPPSLPIHECEREVPKKITTSEIPLASKRSLSAGAVLQYCFSKPFIVARWASSRLFECDFKAFATFY